MIKTADLRTFALLWFMLSMMGGSTAQLEEFARALSRELEPKT